ncbi:MAG: GAF domain-containing protein [Candidatus Uhrbacteria bacterium]|nr:GAF domain-containing protein [Candidatus Uhrbacteria bacterium]
MKTPAVFHESITENFPDLASFPEYNPNPLIQLSASGDIQYMNSAAKQLFPDMGMFRMEHPFLKGLEKFFQKTPKNYLNILTREVFVNGHFYTQTLTKVPKTTMFRLFGTDITELKRIDLEREQFFKFFNLSTDIMVIADPNGAFKRVNPTCLKELGYSEAELLSKSFIDFIHPDDKQSTRDEMAHQIKTGSSLNFENRYICKDGSFIWLSWRANYNKEDGITYATARNITERKESELELVRVNRALHMVSSINQTLIRAADEKMLLNETCRIAADEGGYHLAWVGFAEQDKTKTVRSVAQAGSGVEYLKSLQITWADEKYGHGPTGTAIRTGKTQISSDIGNDPKMLPWKKSALKNGLKSSIALPLISEGEMLGALTIYSNEINAFNEKEIKILEELAGDLAFGIVTHRIRVERALIDKELVRVNRALRMLNENNQALIRVTDEKTLLDKISEVIVSSGGYRLMWIGFAEHDKDKTVRPVAQAGFGTDYLKYTKITWADDAHGRGPTGLAIRTGKTQIARDIQTDPKMTPWRQAAVDRGYKTSIALPLLSGEQIIGALNIYSSELDSFGSQEVQVLEELAADLAFGIATLRLKKKIEERTKEVDQLKNNFIQIVSHQLRTPLTVIRWNIGAILERQRGDVAPAQEEALKGAYAANTQIIERIGDLLAAIDIEEGRIRLETDEVSIADLYKSISEEKLLPCHLKNISYEIIAPDKSLPEISIDAIKIRDVIVRLIDNAIAYSNEGGHITVKLFRKEDNVRFEISDTGIGIPETEQAHIFERFHRGWNAALMRPDASGLSLFISKHYVEMHKGTIGFSSVEKKGSTFWFELPLQA